MEQYSRQRYEDYNSFMRRHQQTVWRVCYDFALSDIVETIEDIAPRAIFSRQVNRHDYAQVVRGDSPDAEILAISCDTKTFAVFHTRNAAEIHAVFCYNYEEENIN